MELILVEYLQALYPLLAREHYSSWPMERLRCCFANLRSVRAGCNRSLRYPTGHVVAMILQCLDDVDVSGLSDDVDVSGFFVF